jgi:hypothetical protein
MSLLLSFIFFSQLDSQKLDSCNEGGLNLISKNNNNNSNNNRNRTTSSNYIINNELPSDDIDPTIVKSERVLVSSVRSHCETETEKNEEQHEKSGADDSQESASENEGDNNNNEDEEREEGAICEDQDPSKVNVEKSKMYKKKKRRRRKREMTLKSDQSQQIEDDDDEMAAIKESPIDDENDGNLSDNYINRKHSVSINRRRHSSSSDPVNLSIGKANCSGHQDDSDDANIDVETISNAPTKVSITPFIFCKHFFSSSFVERNH